MFMNGDRLNFKSFKNTFQAHGLYNVERDGKIIMRKGQEMLAQFSNQTKNLLATHLFTRGTAPSHGIAQSV
jgi:hypothetical protein